MDNYSLLIGGSAKQNNFSDCTINHSKTNNVFEMMIRDSNQEMNEKRDDAETLIGHQATADASKNISPDAVELASLMHSEQKQDVSNGVVAKIVETYEQKFFATGKLSYLRAYEASREIGAETKSVPTSPNGGINSKQVKDTAVHLAQTSVSKDVQENRIAIVTVANKVISTDRNKHSFVVTPNPLIKANRIEKEKVTEIIKEGRGKVYIRSYFSGLNSANEVVSYYLNKFKQKIQLIINGKVR